jgi:hypothetical protein
MPNCVRDLADEINQARVRHEQEQDDQEYDNPEDRVARKSFHRFAILSACGP